MVEKRELTTKPSIVEVEYPYNLLIAIVGTSKLQAPLNMTDDRIRGLQYAISTLDPREYEILMYRYNSKLTLRAIGDIYGLSVERMRQVENKALRKLRTPSRWNYIQLGVAGYWQQRKKQYFDQGYRTGYLDGYRTGVKDEKENKTSAYTNNPSLDLLIENLELSTRAFQCLRRMQCSRIGDVAEQSADNILKTRNMGKITMDEIARALHKLNITGTEWDQFVLPK